MYFAIVGDIIKSKQLQKRAELQNKISITLNEINSKYSSVIAANFIITLGDEFQGLMTSPEFIIDAIEKIKYEIYPVNARFGVGIGGIDTAINKNMAIGADGPAFHYARNMINEIKLNEKGKMSDSTHIKIYAEEKKSIVDLINSNLTLCSFIENKWTKKQRDLIQESIKENRSQRVIAAEYNLAQSSVQRRLKTAGFYDYINTKKVIKRIMIKEWG